MQSMFLFTLTASLPFLRPPPCSSGPCKPPATWQLGVLYAALASLTVGLGGTRFTSAAMGAAQFDEAGDRDVFFSWYVVGLYVSAIIGIAGIVYVQDNAGWTVGFALSSAIAMLGLIVFLLGSRYYRKPKPERNAFVDILRRIVSNAERKKTVSSEDPLLHSTSIETSAEQVREDDDLGTLLRLVPLITTGIVLSLFLSVQLNIFFLQVLTTDRHLGPHFSIPVGSTSIFNLAAIVVSIPLLDHLVYPAYRALAGEPPTPLQRIGLGMVISVLAMVYGAVAESWRLDALRGSGEPFSVLWLVPCLLLVGLGEALSFPGQLAFYFQEFPASLKGLGTAVSALQAGTASFLTPAVIGLIRKLTGWIQNDANASRLDNVYWILASTGVLNFGCFLACAKLYPKKREGGDERFE